MKKTGIYITLILLNLSLLFGENSFFDNYVYQTWNSFGQLNGTTATDILQTKDGYINIGTYEGLARFDGLTFSTHKRSSNNDLTFVSVRCFIQDSRGNLWIGSNDEGLQKIGPDGKKTFTTEQGLPSNSIRCLTEDLEGNIWIGTASGIVYLTPRENLLTPQFESESYAKGIICTSIYCDTAGRIWLLTVNKNGIYTYADGVFKNYRELKNYEPYIATAFAQDCYGAFWIGLGDKGIVKVSDGHVTKIKSNTIADTVPATNFYCHNSIMWIGTEKGLVTYTNGVFTKYTGEILDSAKISRVISDREENIWIATDRCGIGKLTHGKFKMNRMDVSVNAICEDQNENYWIGTDNGLKCIKNDVEVTNPLTEYATGVRIRDISTTKNGDILVSCYSKYGQLKYDGKNIYSWTMNQGLAGNKVRVAIEAKSGELYVGTTTGLSIIHKDGSIKNFKLKDGLDNEYIMALHQDSMGIIWIGTDGGGIYLMKDEKLISHITSEDGLAGNVIFKISQQADDSIWISSGSGITRCRGFNEEKQKPLEYETVNSNQGLQTDAVFQVITDSTNNLWMTSNRGISSGKFPEIVNAAEGKTKSVNVKFYNKSDGLDSGGPTSTSKSIIDRHGRVWFAMIDGVAIYDPVKITENIVTPLIQIESITVDDQVIMDNKLYPHHNKEIKLTPGTKRIDITYTGLSFDAPERILFTHKLTNFEDEFTSPTPLRTVSYTNLSPGKHIFLINAINGDGFFSNQAQTVLFVQEPFIYQMPAFWIIIGLIVLGIIFLFFYLKHRAIIKENLKLENMVLQRTAELSREREKSDELLRAILPNEIADELKDGIHSIGQDFADATILFADIVGFTKTSSAFTAKEIVDALNNLFTLFDKRAQQMGVEKIKTIGDAYMATCGLPTVNPYHAKIMVDYAKGLLKDVRDYNVDAKIPFEIRIGLNSGPVTAGVIGRTKFIYDVWGNTVNVASRMETAASPGCIRVSQTVYDHLKDKNYKFSQPIQCDIKGKGIMTTYDLLVD
ncbi:adenylate/guanylate cyclase domain-containing protein [Treponema sp.]|uniref:adenylate/guanylate cyclase domain-containing protein n=1 Tax=Treponema sp. TaxID=166 RepID=UPI0025DD29C4|nr:adenylate/guanylate cyclase domain-containing protein [Treponema sp.]MCR5219050.1 hypothetical protein [Treponema sp.]